MKVWIDPVECMGAGTCEQIAPDVFHPRGDGTWVVKESAQFFGSTRLFDGVDGPEGADGTARIPEPLFDSVVDAAEQCPGECIFVEV
jgi:ferredoxin